MIRALGIVACILIIGYFEPVHGAPVGFREVICPQDWKIIVSQRYDVRNRKGVIVKSVWVARCV